MKKYIEDKDIIEKTYKLIEIKSHMDLKIGDIFVHKFSRQTFEIIEFLIDEKTEFNVWAHYRKTGGAIQSQFYLNDLNFVKSGFKIYRNNKYYFRIINFNYLKNL